MTKQQERLLEGMLKAARELNLPVPSVQIEYPTKHTRDVEEFLRKKREWEKALEGLPEMKFKGYEQQPAYKSA
ncbi:hypothetical protein JXB27_02170 [Candidatus Woesearchaeota archaeon]|nr:hypothetical protein [Candidatus Woesearchaeota archaeon]